MSTLEKLTGNLYVVWAIASKDVVGALQNKNTRVNLILMIGMVVFFYWASTVRPFDKRIDVVIFDEGSTSLPVGSTELESGYIIRFYEASSIPEMERMMGYKELGVVIPAEFDRTLEAGGEPTLKGYILWVHRTKKDELESKYTQLLTELIGKPVRVSIRDNFVFPRYDVETSTQHLNIFFVVLWAAIGLVPYLMLEEKQTKTMDALLVSPASAHQVVMGKALAGFFYVTLIACWAFALNWAYITNWGLALLAFLCCALFSIGLGLALGNVVQSPQQLSLWMIPIIIFLLLPAFFAQEPFLNAALKAILPWVPTSAIASLFQFSFSKDVPLPKLLINLGIVLVSIGVIYTLVVWQVRRMYR